MNLCRKGHDRDICGKAGDGHCRACKKLTQKKYAVSVKGKTLEQNKRYKLLGISKSDGTFFTADDYNTEFVKQNGLCLLCNKNPDVKRLSVDHDHATGLYRGLLCSICNRYRLPVLEESQSYAERVAWYLTKDYNPSKNTRAA